MPTFEDKPWRVVAFGTGVGNTGAHVEEVSDDAEADAEYQQEVMASSAAWAAQSLWWPSMLMSACGMYMYLPDPSKGMAQTCSQLQSFGCPARGQPPAGNGQAPATCKRKVHLGNQDKDDDPSFTTVMLKNVPSTYTRELLIATLIAAGFHKRFNFVYLPVEFKKEKLLGYAFVNLIDHETAVQFREEMHGFGGWLADVQGRQLALDGNRVMAAEVRWGQLHDKGEHIKRYRNSDLMHPSVPDDYKPMLFGLDGEKEPFPEPDSGMRLQAPRAMKADRSACGVRIGSCAALAQT